MGSNPELAISTMCTLLAPRKLKDCVYSEVRLNTNNLKKDWKSFFSFVLSEGISCERYAPLTEEDLKSHKNVGDGKSKKTPPTTTIVSGSPRKRSKKG